MIQPLSRFWPSLERVPDLALTMSGWSKLLGDDLAVMTPFLRPTQRIARSMPCAEAHRNCLHEVRPWKRQYLSVCPEGCETIPLTRDQVTIHKLDVAKLAKELARLLGLEAIAAEQLTSPAGLWRIGDYVPLAGFRFPVYLIFTGEPDPLLRAAEGLVARATPFILAISSRSALTQRTQDVIHNAKASFISLSECVGHNDSKLCLREEYSPKSIFADFSALHLPKLNHSDGMIRFPTPPGAKWEDVSIQIIDGETVSVRIKDQTAVLLYSQMGLIDRRSKRPSKQWALLRDFADEHGTLDWTSRKADRRKQKRRELLAKDLRRFFRIEQDPFVIEGNGWRALFEISNK